ncbi:M23 family metallopeptidase [Variovorax sp. J31P207]|uniref:M23 family metallopeptidase n=1 Tax=Variovorax sp. J31P207 TaxID=3053510 RepID=UPI002578295C|nr:M23 family metallopeptidase [Variovorax sp. J31P207]MDM0072194.1 M23 family metallopeptidase [Variovorax sp. J31P207]
MPVRPSFFFGARHHFSNGSFRFVTRRTAAVMAIACTAAASAIALATGTAIGMHWAEREAANRHTAIDAERAYVVDELGRLNASVAQIEPRIARLAEHVSELRRLQSRLQASKAAQHAPPDAGADPGSAAGGPALPPRPCAGARAERVPAQIESTRRELDCMVQTLTRLEQEAVTQAVAWAVLPGRSPVDGARPGSPFGNRLDPFDHRLSFHSGIDLAAPTGTPILATAGGRVSFSGQKAGYGNMIEIAHGNHLVTRYGHASRLIASEGDLVLPRQHIADVGSTGRSTGPHLHFEVLEGGEQIDPAYYLSLFAAKSHD